MPRFTKLAFTQEFSVDIFREYYAKRVKNVKQQHSIHAVKKTVAFGVQIFMKATFSQRVLRAEKRTVCLPHLRSYLEKLPRKMLLHNVTLDNRRARKTKARYSIRPWTKLKLDKRGRSTRAEKFVISDLSQGYVNQRNWLRIWRTKSKITKWTNVLHPIRNCVAAKSSSSVWTTTRTAKLHVPECVNNNTPLPAVTNCRSH